MMKHKDDEATNADLHLRLSAKYMAYKDLADRCLLNPEHVCKYFQSIWWCIINFLSIFRKRRKTSILYETEKPIPARAKSAESV